MLHAADAAPLVASCSIGQSKVDVCFSVVQARSRKVEAQSKLEQLQRDIAELSSLSPDTVATEEEVTHKLQQVGPMIGTIKVQSRRR